MLVDASVPQLLSDLLGGTRTEDEYEQVIQWSIHLSVYCISCRTSLFVAVPLILSNQHKFIKIKGFKYTAVLTHGDIVIFKHSIDFDEIVSQS